MTSTTGYESALDRVRFAVETAEPAFGSFFVAKFLGLEISYQDDERTCTVALPYAPYLCNPQGSMHGGVIATAMDISMGHLCHRYLSTAVTIEMQLRFFRPLTGAGRCVGRLLKPGRRVVHLESRMYDGQDRLTALANSSWHRLETTNQPDLVNASPVAGRRHSG